MREKSNVTDYCTTALHTPTTLRRDHSKTLQHQPVSDERKEWLRTVTLESNKITKMAILGLQQEVIRPLSIESWCCPSISLGFLSLGVGELNRTLTSGTTPRHINEPWVDAYLVEDMPAA